jgi:hypothetical protein
MTTIGLAMIDFLNLFNSIQIPYRAERHCTALHCLHCIALHHCTDSLCGD